MERPPLALVTGASTGIGREIAAELGRRGYDLLVAADEPTVQDAAAELRAEGIEVVACQVDLSTPSGVEQLAAEVESSGRPLDALVLNAGVGVGGAFLDGALEDHLRLIGLNVTGAVHLAHRLVPAMVARGDGRVLVTSSIAATMPGPYQSTYNASKAFLLSFAQALRQELHDSGVTVTALMPGPTDTEFFARAHLEDTKLGQAPKDDPAEVARDGVEAMLAGDDHVVAGSFKNKVQASVATLMPDRATAALHARLSEPGSGD